jgi:DnaJ-class molecular chaperone
MKWLLFLVAAALVYLFWSRTSAPPESRAAGRPPNPHAVLGLRRGASPEEIAQAYREQMKLYHPDRVAGLGEELQRVAHEKTVEIQRAYDELTRA